MAASNLLTATRGRPILGPLAVKLAAEDDGVPLIASSLRPEALMFREFSLSMRLSELGQSFLGAIFLWRGASARLDLEFLPQLSRLHRTAHLLEELSGRDDVGTYAKALARVLDTTHSAILTVEPRYRHLLLKEASAMLRDSDPLKRAVWKRSETLDVYAASIKSSAVVMGHLVDATWDLDLLVWAMSYRSGNIQKKIEPSLQEFERKVSRAHRDLPLLDIDRW